MRDGAGMVSRIVHYECDTCRKRFSTHREAGNCELDHIVEEAAKRSIEAISVALESYIRDKGA